MPWINFHIFRSNHKCPAGFWRDPTKADETYNYNLKTDNVGCMTKSDEHKEKSKAERARRYAEHKTFCTAEAKKNHKKIYRREKSVSPSLK